MPLLQLLVSSVFIFFVLYAPQPLLTIFSHNYNVSAATSGALMSITMLPLAVAPIFYGLLFARKNPLTLLKVAMLILSVTSLLFALAPTFELLLVLRFIQGLTLPAALTAMTGFIGQQYSAAQLQQNMTRYIGSSILGGYLGRVLAANFASWFTWQSFYFVLALALLILALLIKPKKCQPPVRQAESPKAYLKPLREPLIVRLFLGVFCMFFCFAALMNYLPFILQDVFGITDSKTIGWVYTGYLIGAIISMTTPYLTRYFNNSWLWLSTLFLVYCTALVVMQLPVLSVFLIAFTLFCACMFMIHSSASPLANKLSDAPPTVTNGAYVSFYYSGGALGSFLPGLILQRFGYHAFLLGLLLVCITGLILSYSAYKQEASRC
ncbi:Inner membrane transport protein YnfM [Pseudoalteromonas holothuriae]|uniref:Inner membrane transport protein YnfM n=1 Tax=Pseudoalteromonas holothuriae TaxID=2963714 RepID=A0A9W4VMA2_9GAMM|nr:MULTISPECIES: MFS transporter [unclassified Pseudoalteromonas]CAH9049660.1 Inner membrane transport protein YnfM [Pseudoalteromonas sp. CIP111854]CAH9051538.1 Inner membrane transport protein YnfM [Pseudoalteromonas sp. CIP111951]